jgi:hypothetical protein
MQVLNICAKKFIAVSKLVRVHGIFLNLWRRDGRGKSGKK